MAAVWDMSSLVFLTNPSLLGGRSPRLASEGGQRSFGGCPLSGPLPVLGSSLAGPGAAKATRGFVGVGASEVWPELGS